MKKLIICMHISLDGYVAGPKGEMDWIHVDEELFDYTGKFTEEADTALYGRITFEMMENYWPTAADQPRATKHDKDHGRWYNNVTKIVLSKSKQLESERVKVISSNLREEIDRKKREGGKNILVFGSPTAVQSLMQENLVDEFWLFLNPVLLGQGIALFRGLHERIKLTLLRSKRFSSGVIGLHYLVNRS